MTTPSRRRALLYGTAALFAVSIFSVLLILILIFRPQRTDREYILSLKDGSDIVELTIDSVNTSLNLQFNYPTQTSYNLRGQGSQLFFMITTFWGTYENVENNLQITGWARIPGEEIVIPCPKIVLHDPESDCYYSLYTEVQYREDLADTLGEEYRMAGFKASVPFSWLPSGATYEICLLYQNDGHELFVPTDQTIQI